eukprot:TRINITY_DN25127_c0_g1_i1.p1 TRINITY_DN25127_c0_g1~~TRINITY_DN25127_c0_g1_i1.p1  ORF type:complete len:488 (+),score=84.26 TRINITY_DN25127_c0_g1_i1:157-1464(+)
MARLCRLLRLLRVTKLFSQLKELRMLMQLVATCAKTMLWSFLMSFLVMSMWAVVAVEVVQPVAQRLVEEGEWADCERCGRAFESVMASNLTFWQTVLAGDSWGRVALPVIEASPWTAVVFCGSSLSLTYGIMQLITAVVVDSVAMSRKRDVDSLAHEMIAVEKEEKEVLSKIFNRIDQDGNGQVTFEELTAGARRVKEFQDWLRVMDIDTGDLERLFKIIDADNSGEIDLTEFIHVLYRLKNAESNTTTKLVKHVVDNLEKTTEDLVQQCSSLQTTIREMQQAHMQRQMQLQRHLQSQLDRYNRRLDNKQTAMKDVEASLQKACAVAVESALTVVTDKVQKLSTTREGSPRPHTAKDARRQLFDPEDIFGLSRAVYGSKEADAPQSNLLDGLSDCGLGGLDDRCEGDASRNWAHCLVPRREEEACSEAATKTTSS